MAKTLSAVFVADWLEEVEGAEAWGSIAFGGPIATAGGLVFWGDLDRRLHAFDAESGAILWETILGGAIQMSTITYAVDGKQYLAVFTGEGLLTGSLIEWAGIHPARNHNAVYVFSLPN